jgi:hypothetical protein
MNKHIWAGLVALALLVVASPVHAWTVDCGASPHLGVNSGGGSWSGGGGGMQAGPWYLYFPYEAHFQLPAPVGYPFWPGPVTAAAPRDYYPAGVPGPLSVPEARPLSPVGYYYYGGVPFAPAPSYWYGR